MTSAPGLLHRSMFQFPTPSSPNGGDTTALSTIPASMMFGTVVENTKSKAMTERLTQPLRASYPEERRRLPNDFRPTPYCVVSGRGKTCNNATGNRRLQVIVQLFLKRYSKATKKTMKSQIVSDVVDMIRSAGGNFIRMENGRWYEVGDAVAREKVGGIFRDHIQGKQQQRDQPTTAVSSSSRQQQQPQSRTRKISHADAALQCSLWQEEDHVVKQSSQSSYSSSSFDSGVFWPV